MAIDKDNPLYVLMLEHGMNEREVNEVRFAQHYAFEFLHGTDGHTRLVTISKLAGVLFDVAESIGMHGHLLRCPKCNQQLTSLLLCATCNTRYEIAPTGSTKRLDWLAEHATSDYDASDIVFEGAD